MGGKGQTTQTPKVAGLDDLDVPTNETNVPAPYFAGVRRLNVSWICYPLVTKTTNVPSGGKGK
jgi:hypothetical protein